MTLAEANNLFEQAQANYDEICADYEAGEADYSDLCNAEINLQQATDWLVNLEDLEDELPG